MAHDDLSVWLKASAENKITQKNAWQATLIDHFVGIKPKGNVNFQKASCTLEGCMKVYSTRVDDVSDNTLKLLGIFNKDENPKKKQQTKKKSNFIEKNLGNISLKEQSNDNFYDPLFSSILSRNDDYCLLDFLEPSDAGMVIYSHRSEDLIMSEPDYDERLDFNETNMNNCESMIAGFFVTLFSLVVDYRKKANTDENWALSQIKAFETIQNTLYIQPVTLSQARVAFSQMFKNDDEFLPLVFLDESQKTEDPNFMRDYKTMRKIIRNIGLIPVFMGTNANLVNFISAQAADGSRSGIRVVWSYIVYKLAGPSQSFLSSGKDKVCKIIDRSNNFSPRIKEEFCNLSLTSPEYKLENSITTSNQSGDNTSNTSIILIDKASGIHNHIAHLFADSRWLSDTGAKTIFPLVLASKEIKVSMNDGNVSACKFTPQQIFASFSKESIGHLAFIGHSIQKDLSFVSRNISNRSIVRTSVRKAFHDLFSNIRSYNTAPTIQKADWTSLEILSSVSALIATHYFGYKGLNCEIWLSNFFRELDLNADFKKEPPVLNFLNCPEQYKNIILNTKVPFCSPTINEKWSEEFGEYLCKNRANLGVLNSFG